MDNILDLARMQQMQQPVPQNEPKPTENAHIVFNYDFASPAPIYRFNKAKDGRKVYEAVAKAWQSRRDWLASIGERKKAAPSLFEIKADMFDGWIDLDRVVAISFVEWPKRGKFIPQ